MLSARDNPRDVWSIWSSVYYCLVPVFFPAHRLLSQAVGSVTTYLCLGSTSCVSSSCMRGIKASLPPSVSSSRSPQHHQPLSSSPGLPVIQTLSRLSMPAIILSTPAKQRMNKLESNTTKHPLLQRRRRVHPNNSSTPPQSLTSTSTTTPPLGHAFSHLHSSQKPQSAFTIIKSVCRSPPTSKT